MVPAPLTNSTSNIISGTKVERAALTGDITAAQNSNATTISENAVTSAKIADGTIAAVDLSAIGATTDDVLRWNGTQWTPEKAVKTGPIAFDRSRSYALPEGILRYDATTQKLYYRGALDIYWGGNFIPTASSVATYTNSTFEHANPFLEDYEYELLPYYYLANNLNGSSSSSELFFQNSPLSATNFVNVVSFNPLIMYVIAATNTSEYIVFRLNLTWFTPLD